MIARYARRIPAFLLTAGIFYLIFKRVPFERFLGALGEADYGHFLALMVLNTVIYIGWDTLVLVVAVRWFHGPIRFVDLLPIRTASYIVAAVNTNAGRGALAIFISRLLGRPLLQIGSTIIFLVLTEYTHLVAWAALGLLVFGRQLDHPLLWVPPAVAAFWLLFFAYGRVARAYGSEQPASTRLAVVCRWLTAPWRGGLLRTFRLAPATKYVMIVLLRGPMFFVSLSLHYFAAPAFGLAIPFGHMLMFLPVVFMVAALPVTVARLGTTQAAWILLFGTVADVERLLAFSLAAHLTFALTRAAAGLLFLPRAYRDLVDRPGAPRPMLGAAAQSEALRQNRIVSGR